MVTAVNKVVKCTSYFLMLGMIAIGVMSIVATGGGDGGGDVTDEAPDVPNLLNYEIRQIEGVTLTVEQGGNQATVSSSSLLGTYNRITELFTLDSLGPVMSVSASDFLADLDTELGNDIDANVDFSNYTLQVNAVATWVGDDNPTSGVFDIRDNPFRNITVSINSNVNNTGMAGVDITYKPFGDAGQSQSMSLAWNEFDGLFEDVNAESYARVASFGFSVWRFMYEQSGLVITALKYMSEIDTALEQDGSVTENCDQYPLPVLPEEPVPSLGARVFTWNDDMSNGELGPGDSFSWEFIKCWNDDESDDFDFLYHNRLNLVNYVEVVNENVVTRIGFEPTQGPGGVDFCNLVLTETETTFENIILGVNDAFILNGGFSIVFTSP